MLTGATTGEQTLIQALKSHVVTRSDVAPVPGPGTAVLPPQVTTVPVQPRIEPRTDLKAVLSTPRATIAPVNNRLALQAPMVNHVAPVALGRTNAIGRMSFAPVAPHVGGLGGMHMGGFGLRSRDTGPATPSEEQSEGAQD
jgi:hypothetical protein